ncbi:MAG: Smr/MutS family protein [Bdellovibrionales bacterium]
MLNHLDWTELIRVLETFATSERARESLRHLEPLSEPQAALQSVYEIEEARIIVNSGRRPSMESLDIFATWFERLKKQATLKILELKDVRRFCMEVQGVQEATSSYSSTWLKSIFTELFDPKEALSAIDQIITPSGDIRADASEELSQLFKSKQDKERHLQSTLNKLVKNHGLESVLQDRFVTNREGRWVLPIKSGMQHNFQGIIHDASQTKQTVFMEPQEVISINNELREIEIKIEKEIEKLITELSHYLSTYCLALQKARNTLETVDIRLSQAQLSEQLNAQPFRFSKENMYLSNLRHPILALKNPKVISNTVELTHAQRILLLSGPNAGGKTVLLKAIGLAAQMARCGLPICADENSEVIFFHQIHVAVGDEQSVHRNLSTFAAHLTTLTEATKVKGPEHLILVDEICGATDPEEGSALAKSFIEHFAKSEVFGIITSHLGALKEGWSKESGVLNGRLEYDEIEGKSTYKLFLGLPGQSQALKTAKAIGVPLSIVDRAVELLHPETRHRKKKLDELEAIKDEMLQSKKKMEEEGSRLSALKNSYTEMVEKFKKEREVLIQKSVKLAEQKIEAFIEAAKSSQQQLKSLHEVKDQLPTIIKSPQKVSISSPEEFATSFPRGSLVYVSAVGQDGIVQSEPDSKGLVTILAQSMRVQVSWKDLLPPRNAAKSTAASRPRGGSNQLVVDERIIDLRGQRVEEALRELDSQLDLALRNKEDRLKVIHGHGTEVLKKSVRTYLSRSVYVRKWRSGDNQSGGDGITWVELSDI